MQEDRLEKNLTKTQKTGVVFLFLFALITVGLSFLQIRNNIYNPFALTVSQEEIDAIQSFQYDENVRLQQIDTDKDGLNDYEEINFYNTSRYLPDTDSDGITDKEELELGKDPLCPENEVCVSITDSVDNTSSTDFIVSPLLSNTQTPDNILVDSQIETLNNVTTSSTSSDLDTIINDPDALRELLLSSGKLKESDLAGIDDAALITLAKNLFETKFQNITTSTSQ
ncbi:MAG: hypothetical protein WC070_03790 [Candidatus Magasanikbacteria bacterium]